MCPRGLSGPQAVTPAKELKHKKILLPRCKHHFKSDLMINMDHIRNMDQSESTHVMHVVYFYTNGKTMEYFACYSKNWMERLGSLNRHLTQVEWQITLKRFVIYRCVCNVCTKCNRILFFVHILVLFVKIIFGINKYILATYSKISLSIPF